MIPFWKKTGKHSKPQSAQKRRQNVKPAVPRTAQQSIPMQRMFEDGTCRVKANYYTRTIQYQDINYQLAQQEDKTAIFEEWCSFLNFFDSSIKFELSFVNMATDSTEFEKSIRIPYQRDGFDDVRAEYSQMFDRLGRRDDETPFIVEWFTKQGIEVWSVNEGQQRFDTHVDKLMNYIRYWQASGESLKTSVRTRTRLKQLTGEGHYTGGTVAFGYKRVRLGRVNKKNQEVCDLVVDEAEAEIFRLIFHKYVYEGYGAQKLSHYLYEQGVVGRNNKNYICNELFTWADVYDTANHDERRAILQQFIKEIRVRKDYEISITLNASFNQVEQLKAVSTYDGAGIFEEISEKGA